MENRSKFSSVALPLYKIPPEGWGVLFFEGKGGFRVLMEKISSCGFPCPNTLPHIFPQSASATASQDYQNPLTDVQLSHFERMAEEQCTIQPPRNKPQ